MEFMPITNIEFYNTPEGDVMMKEFGQSAMVLKDTDHPDHRAHACCHQGQIPESTCQVNATLLQ